MCSVDYNNNHCTMHALVVGCCVCCERSTLIIVIVLVIVLIVNLVNRHISHNCLVKWDSLRRILLIHGSRALVVVVIVVAIIVLVIHWLRLLQ